MIPEDRNEIKAMKSATRQNTRASVTLHERFNKLDAVMIADSKKLDELQVKVALVIDILTTFTAEAARLKEHKP